MLELAGDFRLLDESIPKQGARVSSIGPKLLEGDLAAHMNVACQPHLADTALSMKLGEPVTLEPITERRTCRVAR